jgi:TrmH family RNA methyltransferase
MISKAKLKFIRSLEQKKYRRQEGVFVAEGPKVVGDLLAVMPARELFATREWMESRHPHRAETVVEVTEDELRKLSFLQHPQQVLGVFDIPKASVAEGAPGSQLSLALDGVQDPGNLGTIIRLADWFGIDTIYCSLDSADAYNPKVIQATMGSIARVHIIYTDLAVFIDSLPAGTPVYGTFLDGENIYRQTLQPRGLIVMGNEGKGVSPEIARRVSHRLLIPNYPEGRATADSLNVAIATAIVCSEFRRQP